MFVLGRMVGLHFDGTASRSIDQGVRYGERWRVDCAKPLLGHSTHHPRDPGGLIEHDSTPKPTPTRQQASQPASQPARVAAPVLHSEQSINRGRFGAMSIQSQYIAS